MEVFQHARGSYDHMKARGGRTAKVLKHMTHRTRFFLVRTCATFLHDEGRDLEKVELLQEAEKQIFHFTKATPSTPELGICQQQLAQHESWPVLDSLRQR